jgi:hypothetical protein
LIYTGGLSTNRATATSSIRGLFPYRRTIAMQSHCESFKARCDTHCTRYVVLSRHHRPQGGVRLTTPRGYQCEHVRLTASLEMICLLSSDPSLTDSALHGSFVYACGEAHPENPTTTYQPWGIASPLLHPSKWAVNYYCEYKHKTRPLSHGRELIT